MAKPAKFTVTLPDGTVATRSSVRHNYTHAVVLTTPREVEARSIERMLSAARSDLERREEALLIGTVAREGRVMGGGSYEYVTVTVGDEIVAGYMVGEAALTDEDAVAILAARVEDNRRKIAAYEEAVAETLAGPLEHYSVLRWSGSLVNATKALREFSNYETSGRFLRVVEVD